MAVGVCLGGGNTNPVGHGPSLFVPGKFDLLQTMLDSGQWPSVLAGQAGYQDPCTNRGMRWTFHPTETHGWESSQVVSRQISDTVGKGMPLGPGGPCGFAVRNFAEPFLTLPWGGGSLPSLWYPLTAC